MNTTTKQQQRKQVREALKAMSQESIFEKSKQINKEIIESKLLDEFTDILLYKALPYEVNLDILINYLLDKGKSVYLPRINGDDMEIVKLPCECAVGAYNIMEPIGKAYSGKIDAVIAPALAVDRKNSRLGKGKGYYDRFLAYNNCYKIAVAFSEQTFDEIVTDLRDIRMDKVIVN